MLNVSPIEDAIVSALAGDSVVVTYAGHVGGWAGQVDTARKTGVVLKYPAILVVYVGGPIAPKGAFRFAQKARFQVTLLARNLRSPASGAARSASAASEKGIYDMLPDVLRILSGQDLGQDMSELMPVDVGFVDQADAEPGVLQYAIAFDTEVVFDMDDENVQSGTTDLTSIHASHQVLRDADDTLVDVVTDTIDTSP